MLSEGMATSRGRRGAFLHRDQVNHRLRGRRGARLMAITNGGAIPDSAQYQVVAEPEGTVVGTIDEDFAVESLAGDIFQLGNASWKIIQVVAGAVRVEDAHGQPPGIPFWLGEAPARTTELSRAVSELREQAEARMAGALMEWLSTDNGLSSQAARQLSDYFEATYKVLGVLPSQKTLLMERFFDESGGMQLVIHSPFGARVNRAWGLALRKRFCRSFNFELQSAASDDAIVLSLGTQHSFPLDEVFHYLRSGTVRALLVQALLDAPMFGIRWRWNASRALALPRYRKGHKVPAPLLRMESENLLAAVFPDQLACLENIVGDREVPDHPLVRQTVEDCLTEAMDIDGLEALLRRIENGEVRCIARDLPEPSPLASEILNARPYSFLDNAPLEERRTQAVYTRRSGEPAGEGGLGILDSAAIERVCREAWPQAGNADELHEALLLTGLMTREEALRCAPDASLLLSNLAAEKRAGQVQSRWVAAERLPLVWTVYPGARVEPTILPPEFERQKKWERPAALRELVRGRIEVLGPVTTSVLADFFQLPATEIEQALLALEAEGFVLRGKFRPDATEMEWCDRRLLARIHRLTIHRLREEIQPVPISGLQRFLLIWQKVAAEHRAEGPEGVEAALNLFDGYELSAGAWEPAVLVTRVKDYDPAWLDQLCLTGRLGWGRLSLPQNGKARLAGPLRSSPIALFERENLPHWLELSGLRPPQQLTPETGMVWQTLLAGGALFFGEIARRTGLLKSRTEQCLAELAAMGCVTADSFAGLRGLLVPSDKRASFGDLERKRRRRLVRTIEFAGRWSLLRPPPPAEGAPVDEVAREKAVEVFAHVLLRRYGVVFRRLLERESLKVSWFELGRVYRRLEARGEIRGGYFVSGVSDEQFALPEAIGLLRSVRKEKAANELIVLSAADPLNLVGILTPGARITSIRANRILLRDGAPIAALEGGRIVKLAESEGTPEHEIEQRLKVSRLPAALRLHYG